MSHIKLPMYPHYCQCPMFAGYDRFLERKNLEVLIGTQMHQIATTIMLIDDHPMILDALGAVLKEKFPNSTVLAIGSVFDARSELSNGVVPTLAVVDINLPDGHGVDLIRELHTDYGVKTIAFSGHADRTTISACVKNGASAFVAKSSDTTIFYRAVEAVLLGGQYFPPSSIHNEGQHTGIEIALTKRQLDVLDLVLLGQSNKVIANGLCITEGTVKNHASDLHSIFNTTSRHELIVKAREMRYGHGPRVSHRS